MSASKQKITPPELAEIWGVSPAKVLALIKSGQLRAINLATRHGGRPRYAIDLADVEAFERARLVVPDCGDQRQQPTRRPQPDGTREYF